MSANNKEEGSIIRKVGRPKKDNSKSLRLTVRFEPKHMEIIEKVAKEKNLTKNEVVRLAIELMNK